MIELQYSEKDVPFINLEDYGRLIFSSITSHPEKGYRFLCYNRSYMERIRIKKKTNGESVEKIIKTETRNSCVFDMNLERKVGQQGQTKGITKGTIPPRLGDWLRKTLKKYLTEDKYFPYSNITPFKKYLARQSIDKIIAKPQRKRKNIKREL